MKANILYARKIRKERWKTLSCLMGVVGWGQPKDPFETRGGENPKTPIIGCAISRVTTIIK